MKLRILYCLFLAIILLPACEKADKYNPSPRDNFEALWRILDENYCFFEFKNIDWDEVHDRYSVQIDDKMSQYDLFDVLGKMLAELKDGHTNLFSSFDVAVTGLGMRIIRLISIRTYRRIIWGQIIKLPVD